MSTVKISTNQSVIRLTPEGETSSSLVLHNQQSVIRVSDVGLPGPKGDQGLPGRDGQDGEAGIPEILDGGNF